MSDIVIFDIETDGLLDNVSKIHVLSYSTLSMNEPKSIFNYDDMIEFFKQDYTFVGHNIICYDNVVLKRILGESPRKVIDTLPLSWYLNFDRPRHGLEGYGDDYGIPKPVVTDWENLSQEDYAHRCEEDVKINTRLYRELMAKLNRIYGSVEASMEFIDYLNFKMDCLREQEEIGIKLDVASAQKHYDTLLKMQGEKVTQLAEVMPDKPIFKERNKPKIMYKKDGSLSANGEKWVSLLSELKMPDTTTNVKLIDGYEKANPNSSDQVKDWLYALGWKPATFKFVRDKVTRKERTIPQVRSDGELCPSVLALVDENPDVGVLDGLTIIQHRLSIFKGFLANHENGIIRARSAGFTNTLRFRHCNPLVNLPGVDKPWGKEIRGCLTAPSGYTYCGADMVSLEDTTKRHYMQPYDPDYVAEMQKEGFDPHLDLAKFSGRVTQDEIDQYNLGQNPGLKTLRKAFKTVNYSATYGIQPPKLAREMGISEVDAAILLDAFWGRNWSVQRVAQDCRVRTVGGVTWLQNPVSGFWYELRNDKDRFSTLNQGTGVYCFDTWVRLCREQGVKVVAQFHDEIIAPAIVGQEDALTRKLTTAIARLNDKVRLNVPLGIDYSFGKNYAEIH